MKFQAYSLYDKWTFDKQYRPEHSFILYSFVLEFFLSYSKNKVSCVHNRDTISEKGDKISADHNKDTMKS